jgi:hypothetical protein
LPTPVSITGTCAFDHVLDQAGAAARDHQVDAAARVEQLGDARPVGVVDQHDGVGGAPAPQRRRIAATSARFEARASAEPRSTAAEPAMKASAKASTVTLGRDS